MYKIINHMDVLLLLKEAHLLYFIEDNLPTLIEQVAIKTKHGSKEDLLAFILEQFEIFPPRNTPIHPFTILHIFLSIQIQ